MKGEQKANADEGVRMRRVERSATKPGWWMLTFGRLGNVVDGLLHGGDVVGLLVGDLLWKRGEGDVKVW